MSWDIIMFNSNQKIESVEEVDDDQLVETNFIEKIKSHFTKLTEDHESIEVTGEGFSFVCYKDDEPVSNTMINLHGENALYALVELAKKNHWQIFDTGSGEMINLQDPAQNGYENHLRYLNQIENK